MNLLIENLTIAYEHHPAVHHLTTKIAQGEWWAIVGPNGAGKSTLLNAIAGVISDYEGSIEGAQPDMVAYLPQQAQLDKTFPISVFELVATGLWAKMGFCASLSASQHQQCQEALAAVGLQGFEDRMVGSLSGGQLQRTLFARVILQDQPLILLDEPFNAIDSKTLSDLTDVIRQWQRDDRTIVTVTHDLAYVREHCPKALLLARECIGHGDTNAVLTDANLSRARMLSEAFDERANWCLI
ncbi:MAG: ABC transporter ATP-binding protein [Pseudomonadales bacterium]|nr:ABC transporter ATP-binding protein [Pseudomonadales bacterium]MBO6655431.1 ABC transporter ATP-binding protein [Pseudomonadales bacterium]